VRCLGVAYFDQCGGLEDDFSVASSRRNRSLPMGTYLHSQRSRVHWASGKWGTVLPEYSTPNCASTASQASRPGKIRTPRNNPDRCAFLSARIERAICDGVLRIGALISVAPEKCLQTLEFNLIVSPNAQSRLLTSGRRGGLSEIRSVVLSGCECLPLPAPAKQTQRAEAGGEEREGGGKRRSSGDPRTG
jgi:hypothetical protein